MILPREKLAEHCQGLRLIYFVIFVERSGNC